MEIILAGLRFAKELKEYGIYEITLLFASILFLYKYQRDKLENDGELKDIHVKIAAHETRANTIFEKLGNAIESLKDILSNHFISKSDLDKDEYSQITMRIEATAHMVFSEFKRLCLSCNNEICKDCEMIPSVISKLGELRRASFMYWEAQAVPRRILGVVERVDELLFQRHLSFLHDIHNTCLAWKEDKVVQEMKVESMSQMYESKVIEEWKSAFLEKINLR